ncbi:MAG: microcin C ABC transporter permease YejB [Pseudomonadota bacterium]
MLTYLIRRLFLVVPTLFGIMLINFMIVQAAPGGPIEQAIADLSGLGGQATDTITRAGGDILEQPPAGEDSITSGYRGRQGLLPEYIAELEKQYGFDKPLWERFFIMMGDYLTLDFGDSFFRDQGVMELVIDKLPVSLSLGIWTTLIVYLVSIPLGIAKAVRDGTRFDVWSSALLAIGTAVPSYLFAVFLLVLLAGGSYLQIFPLGGLVSDNWREMGTGELIADYLWHMVLPVFAMVIGGFASLSLLTKNSFLDQLRLQYVVTARAKGLAEKRVLYGHVFRNAMLIVIAGFPAAFVGVLFTSSLLIEIIFSLDGLGLLGFEAVIRRDYNVMFGTLFFFSLIGLILNIISDLTYTLVDPRIDFERRG